MPAAKKYSIEPYKGFYVVMKEMAGRKELVVVAVYKKGAEAVKTLVDGLERQLAEATRPQQVRHDNGPPQRLDRFGYRYIARGLKIGGLRKLEDAAIWGLEHMFIVPEER